MRVLVYSHVPLWEQHHAETIEICEKHLKKNDKVFVLNCDRELFSCPANIHKNENLCNKCLRQTKRTFTDLFEKKIININLKLSREKKNIPILNLSEFINYTIDNVPFGRMALSTLITDKLKTSFFSFDDITENGGLEILEFSINLYNNAKRIINEHKIDRVYVWNGRRSCDGPINYAAKNLGIEYYSYISGGQKNKYQCQPTISAMELDYSKKLSQLFYEEHKNNNSLEEFKKEGMMHFNFLKYGKLDGKSYGLIQFSKNFDKKNEFKRKNEKKNIGIFPGSNWEYVALGQNFTTFNGQDFNQYDFLEKIICSKVIKENYNIYVRWHPFLATAGKPERNHLQNINKKYKNVEFIMPESKINSYSLLDFVDIVITFGSTIGVEATIQKKPSILFGRTYWEDSDAAYKPSSLEELENLLLKSDLKPKPLVNALKEGYFQRHRGREEFKYIKIDENLRYYFNNKRIKYLTIKDKFKEFFKILILSSKLSSHFYYKYFEKIAKKII